MSSIARRHHTVPRFYLENFSREGQIGAVLLPGDKRFEQTVRKAATTTDFYLIGDPSGPEADAFEQVLSRLAGSASRDIRSVLDGTWPLAGDDRAVMAEFAAVQFLRGPNLRQHLRDFRAQYSRMEISLKGKEWMRKAFERRGRPLADEEIERLWDQATREEGPRVVVTAEQHIKFLVETLPDIIRYFAARPWLLVRLRRHRLLTCDTPLSLIPTGDTDRWAGVGLLTAWALSLPLSPEVGLLMTDPGPIAAHTTRDYVAEGHLDRVDSPSTVMARVINSATIRNARRFLYHHPDDAARVPADLPEPVDLELEPLGRDFVAMGEAMRAAHRRDPEPDQELSAH